MKLFGWMQSKLNGKQVPKQPNIVASSSNNRIQAPCNEEFSDWPQALFAIGTFGNNNLKEDSERLNNPQGSQASCQDQPQEGIGPEEINELQKELNLLFEKPFTSEDLEENVSGEDSQNNDKTFCRSGSMVFSRGKDILLDNTNNAIGKRSLSFLVKKMFICSSGFSHVPNLRDSFPDAKLEKSRMEKLLRAILHKKIYPQSSAPKAMPKKYLGRRNMSVSDCDSDDEVNENGNDGSKWVKTDSECKYCSGDINTSSFRDSKPLITWHILQVFVRICCFGCTNSRNRSSSHLLSIFLKNGYQFGEKNRKFGA